MNMIPCDSCGRHLANDGASCPFCDDKPQRTPFRTKALHLIGGAATTLVLAACYGPAGIDSDGDGYLSFDDCDDTEASVNPGAAEICDDTIDNDCDGLIDDADDDCTE